MPSDLEKKDIRRIVMCGSKSTNSFDFMLNTFLKIQFKVEYSMHPYNFIRKTFLKIQFKAKHSSFLDKTLFIGDGKKLIEYPKFTQLREKTVADYAPVIINAHGSRTKDGHHTIDLIDGSTGILVDEDQDIPITVTSLMPEILMITRTINQTVSRIMLKCTDNCFKLLSKLVDKPLFVQSYNCYGTTALQYVNSLHEKTILFTYGAAQDPQCSSVLSRCKFGFWQNYENGTTDDCHPIIQIAHNFYDPKSPNFGFLTNIGIAIATRNPCSPNKVELKHKIDEVMQDPKTVAKVNLDILKKLVEDNSKDVDNPVDVLQTLDNLQRNLEEQDVDWGRFIFNTSMVDISTNLSATKVINAWRQNKSSSYVTSFATNYSTQIFTNVTVNTLFLNTDVNNSWYSEYEDNVNFLLDQKIDVNARKYYDISRNVSNDGHPIAWHLMEMLLFNEEFTNEQQQIIGKVLDKLCSHEKFDVNAKDNDGHPIAWYWMGMLLFNEKSTNEQQQILGKALDKLCSHEKFDVNAKDNDGDPVIMDLIQELYPSLKRMDATLKTKNLQIIEQIFDKLCNSPSDVNSVKDKDTCKSYEHQDISDSCSQYEVDRNSIGLSGEDTSSCQNQDLI